MGIIQRYQFYKHLLFVCFVMNVFMLLMGCVALYHFYQNREPQALEVVFVAIGILVFGILLPTYIFSQIQKKLEELRRQTEVVVAEYVSKWVESFKEWGDEEALQNPKFWLNMVLILLEVVGDNSRHPALNAVAEFAPILRSEIKKASHSKTRKSEK